MDVWTPCRRASSQGGCRRVDEGRRGLRPHGWQSACTIGAPERGRSTCRCVPDALGRPDASYQCRLRSRSCRRRRRGRCAPAKLPFAVGTSASNAVVGLHRFAGSRLLCLVRRRLSANRARGVRLYRLPQLSRVPTASRPTNSAAVCVWASGSSRSRNPAERTLLVLLADHAVWAADGCQPNTASNTKNPITYATVTCQPSRTHRPTDFASGNMFDNATPALEPNQIIEPPKPTV